MPYTLTVLSLWLLERSTLLVTKRSSSAGVLRVMEESAVGTLVRGTSFTGVKFVDPALMLYTSLSGADVMTNRKSPAASRVMAMAVSGRIRGSEGAPKLPSEFTV